MNQKIKILIVNLIDGEKNWVGKYLSSFFHMYLKYNDHKEYELTYVTGVEKSARKLISEKKYDLIVIPSEYQSNLLNHTYVNNHSAKIILVSKRIIDKENQGSYWIDKILTLLTWTSYDEFEMLMNQNPMPAIFL